MLEAAAGPILRADARIVAAMQPVKDHALFERLSDLGDEPQLRLLCVGTILLGVLERDRRLVLAGASMLAAQLAAASAKAFVKRRVDRTRPRSLDPANGDHRLSAGRSRAKEHTSFPSGHAAGTAAVAAAFSRAYPGGAAPAFGAAAALSLAQIPRCAHYPSDVAAGAAMGLAAEAALAGALDMAGRALRRAGDRRSGRDAAAPAGEHPLAPPPPLD
jgi:membrane-associated phospholipid phosphatase